MEDIRQDSIITFDTRFTNNHIQMQKIILPYCHSSLQKYIAIYIKFQEIQCTMEYFLQPRPANCKEASFDFNILYSQLLPYCSQKEIQTFSQLHNLFETIENLKNIMDMMEAMKTLFPEGMGSSEDGCFNPDIITSMMNMFGSSSNTDFSTEAFVSMAEMFQGISSPT